MIESFREIRAYSKECYFLKRKGKEIVRQATAWMDFGDIVLSEMSQ